MPEKSKLKISLSAFLITVSLVGIYWLPAHLAVDLAPSLPYHVFFLRKHSDDREIRKSSLVMFVHDHPMATSLKTKNLVKRVSCIEGEFLRVEDRKYYCGDRYLGKAKTHSLTGVPVKNFVFNGRIPIGFLFVMGTNKDSYDSRYFGFISRKEVAAIAYPVF